MNDTTTRSLLQQLLEEASQRNTKRLQDEEEAARIAIRAEYERNRSFLEQRFTTLLGAEFVSYGHFEQTEEMSPHAVFCVTEAGMTARMWVEQVGNGLWLYVESSAYENHFYIPDSPGSTFRDEVLHSVMRALIEAIPF